MTDAPTYVGIDVAQDRLDVVLRPSGEYLEATNDERGIGSVVRRLRKGNVVLVVLEFYYRCPKRQRHGLQACRHNTHYRAAEREARVWEFVSGLLRDPERLRIGLEEMIERERAGSRGDPEREIAFWLEKAAEADRKRSGFQDMAAEGLITLDELRAKLAGLVETRKAAEAEMEHLRGRLERVEALERDRDALLDGYAALMPEDLQELGPEERRQIYAMLRLRVVVDINGDMAMTGIIRTEKTLCKTRPTRPSTTSSRRAASARQRRA